MSDTVLLLQTKSKTPSREQIAGAFRYLDTTGWDVRLVELNPSARELKKSIAKWCPVGCIIERALTHGRNPIRLMKGIPTVYLNQNPNTAAPRNWYVAHDSRATVRLAFAELKRNNPVHYAFVRDSRSVFWNETRTQAFCSLAASDKVLCTTICDDINLQERLMALPKPCGLLAANDFIAAKVISAAHKSGIDLPKDLQVVGINNDEFVCEHTRPTLTSVHPDFERSGYLAMAMLHRIVCGTKAHPSTILFGPKAIIRRASTRILTRSDLRVTKALDLISNRFTDPNLHSDTIAVVMGCSRRLADLRFRKIIGHTIREEIQTARIDEAKRLLADSTRQISAIPSLCGYSSLPSFANLFKRTTGMTMKAWRRSHS